MQCSAVKGGLQLKLANLKAEKLHKVGNKFVLQTSQNYL